MVVERVSFCSRRAAISSRVSVAGNSEVEHEKVGAAVEEGGQGKQRVVEGEHAVAALLERLGQRGGEDEVGLENDDLGQEGLPAVREGAARRNGKAAGAY